MKEQLLAISLPEGWVPIPIENIPERFPQNVELICAVPQAAQDFATNVVVLSDAQVPEKIDVWVAGSLRDLVAEIPGFRVLDQQLWASEDFGGAMIVGTYIMESTSVTLCRWLLIGSKVAATIDATCASVAFKQMLPGFVEFAHAVKER